MSSFQVTPADLQSLAGQLSGLLGELEQAASRIPAGGADAAQNVQLEQAITGFLSEWLGDLDRLRTKLGTLAHRLDAAGSSYEASESSLAERFESSTR